MQFNPSRSCIYSVLAVLLVLAGCVRDNTSADARNQRESPVSTTNDPAKYQFHRNKSLVGVTKAMPEGSVDHIDFNFSDTGGKVIVVVTISGTHGKDARFVTTFSGEDGIEIVKKWKPAGLDDDQHVALFVLPEGITSAETVVK